MRWVEQPVVRPHHCAVLPFVGAASTTKGFIDTGTELAGFDNHVYVSVEAVEEMARMLGWEPPGVIRDLNHQLVSTAAQLQQAQGDLDAMQGVVDAIDVIESADFRARRKPGRKPKEEVAV